MNNKVEVIDGDGWRKAFPLEKNIIHIGSDPRNDIVLAQTRGTGVAPRHIQLVALSADQGAYRLVNLGDADILLDAGEALASRASMDIRGGEHIKVGDFALVFRCGEAVSAAVGGAPPAEGVVAAPALPVVRPGSDSQVIDLSLFLPQTRLAPDRPIDGSVIVRNQGSKPGVQFKLAVEGLEPDCYEIGAGPLLFPNAEKEVMFRLRHPRRPQPVAGEHRFSVSATAPEAYPGECATVSQVVHILPFYKHKLRLVTAE